MDANTIFQKDIDEVTPEEWLFLENEGRVNGCWAWNTEIRINWVFGLVFWWFFHIISVILSWFKPPLAIFFKASCSKHDFWYGQGGDEKRRKHCDNVFLKYMVADVYYAMSTGKIAEYEFEYYVKWCLRYHKAVRVLGWVRFNYK